MTIIDWLRWIELVAVAVVVITTIYVMQFHLLKAHTLLRVGLALVCAGSVLEFYVSLQTDPTEIALSVVENVGQAAVYVWAATSRRLWRLITLLNNRR